MEKLPYLAPESEVIEVSVERSILSETGTNLDGGQEDDYGEF